MLTIVDVWALESIKLRGTRSEVTARLVSETASSKSLVFAFDDLMGKASLLFTAEIPYFTGAIEFRWSFPTRKFGLKFMFSVNGLNLCTLQSSGETLDALCVVSLCSVNASPGGLVNLQWELAQEGESECVSVDSCFGSLHYVRFRKKARAKSVVVMLVATHVLHCMI